MRLTVHIAGCFGFVQTGCPPSIAMIDFMQNI